MTTLYMQMQERKKGDMKILGATTWAWWCMMMMVVVFMAASVLGYDNVVFDVKAAKGNTALYSKFLEELRKKVADPTNRVCGLRTTQSSPKESSKYITVELKGENTQSVTLGISVVDLYVWGYQDKSNDGKLRATFVNDATKRVKEDLFKDATIRKTTLFKGTYPSLKIAAKTEREELKLDFDNLLTSITSVYGKSEKQLTDKVVARFFLMAAQMVSEAVRFKLMEDSIIQGDNQKSTVSLRVAFQNEWDKISQSITAAQPTCVDLKPERVIDGKEFTNVDQIKGKMALLKAQTKSTIDANYSSLAQDSDAALPLETI